MIDADHVIDDYSILEHVYHTILLPVLIDSLLHTTRATQRREKPAKTEPSLTPK